MVTRFVVNYYILPIDVNAVARQNVVITTFCNVTTFWVATKHNAAIVIYHSNIMYIRIRITSCFGCELFLRGTPDSKMYNAFPEMKTEKRNRSSWFISRPDPTTKRLQILIDCINEEINILVTLVREGEFQESRSETDIYRNNRRVMYRYMDIGLIRGHSLSISLSISTRMDKRTHLCRYN